MSRRVAWGVLCAGLSLVLAGCGTADPTATPAAPRGAALPAGSWVLTGGEDDDGLITPLETHPVTLEVAEGAVSGSAACNRYSGPISDGDGALLSNLAVTEMGCSPATVMALEQRYLDALRRVDGATSPTSRLVLTGPSVRLEFAARAGALEPSLIGEAWVVESVVTGAGPDGAVSSASGETRFRFRAGGRLEVRSCAPWVGRWTEEGDDAIHGRLTISRAGVYDTIPCTPPRRQETRGVARIGAGGGTWRVEGGRLTITASDGSALVLVRADVGARS